MNPPRLPKPYFAKKKFKTGTSKRYRSSLMGSASIPTSAPIETLLEEAVNVDEVITRVVDAILEEAATEVMGPDVTLVAATSGNSANPIYAICIAVSVDEPIEDQPKGEKEESV